MHQGSQRDRSSERGTTLTEAALVSLPFFLIIFAILEMGFLFRNYLTVANTASEAGRAASVYGSSNDADFQILRSADHGVAAMGLDNLEMLVVWRASGPSDTVPPSCLVASQGGSDTAADKDTHPAYDPTVVECNRYLPGDFGLQYFVDANSNGQEDAGENTNYFGCAPDYSVDRKWCPGVRDDAVSASIGGPNTDYVGIYVQVQHTFLTGFFQETKTLHSTKIVRIEPERN